MLHEVCEFCKNNRNHDADLRIHLYGLKVPWNKWGPDPYAKGHFEGFNLHGSKWHFQLLLKFRFLFTTCWWPVFWTAGYWCSCRSL